MLHCGITWWNLIDQALKRQDRFFDLLLRNKRLCLGQHLTIDIESIRFCAEKLTAR